MPFRRRAFLPTVVITLAGLFGPTAPLVRSQTTGGPARVLTLPSTLGRDLF